MQLSNGTVQVGFIFQWQLIYLNKKERILELIYNILKVKVNNLQIIAIKFLDQLSGSYENYYVSPNGSNDLHR